MKIGSYRGFAMLLSYDGMVDGHQLTLRGAMSHTAKLGIDARGNLIRIDNALAAIPKRLLAVTEQLDNLYKQQAAAKAESGKPFSQEKALSVKLARLSVLEAELKLESFENGISEIVIDRQFKITYN